MKPASSAGRPSSETGVPARGGEGWWRGRGKAREGLFTGEATKVANERFHVGSAGGDDANVDFRYPPKVIRDSDPFIVVSFHYCRSISSREGLYLQVTSSALSCHERDVLAMQVAAVLNTRAMSATIKELPGSKISHIIPRPMRKHRESFVRVLICTFQTMTTGKAARMKSVSMENAVIVD